MSFFFNQPDPKRRRFPIPNGVWKWELKPQGFIPVQYSNFEFFGIKGGGYAVRFVDETDWKEYILNVEDVVILRKFFNHHPIVGDGNQPINNTLTMIKASDEGLTEALTVANKVRGLLKQKKAMLAPEDVKKSRRPTTWSRCWRSSTPGLIM